MFKEMQCKVIDLKTAVDRSILRNQEKLKQSRLQGNDEDAERLKTKIYHRQTVRFHINMCRVFGNSETTRKSSN